MAVAVDAAKEQGGLSCRLVDCFAHLPPLQPQRLQVSLRFIEFIHNRFQADGLEFLSLDFDEAGRIFACHPLPMNELLAGLSSKMSMIKK